MLDSMKGNVTASMHAKFVWVIWTKPDVYIRTGIHIEDSLQKVYKTDLVGPKKGT